MTTVPVFVIEGARIRDIRSLYAEVNRVLMPDEDWTLGESLDALDDLLYGGFGVLDGDAAARIVWQHHEVAKAALGEEATRAWYREKLDRPGVYSPGAAQAGLDALAAGTGPTYFELVLRVFAGHPNIELVLD